LDQIWLNKAYLEWREPSLINVNWWAEFKDHPKHGFDLSANNRLIDTKKTAACWSSFFISSKFKCHDFNHFISLLTH
jgi:hypothetical protein